MLGLFAKSSSGRTQQFWAPSAKTHGIGGGELSVLSGAKRLFLTGALSSAASDTDWQRLSGILTRASSCQEPHRRRSECKTGAAPLNSAPAPMTTLLCTDGSTSKKGLHRTSRGGRNHPSSKHSRQNKIRALLCPGKSEKKSPSTAELGMWACQDWQWVHQETQAGALPGLQGRSWRGEPLQGRWEPAVLFLCAYKSLCCKPGLEEGGTTSPGGARQAVGGKGMCPNRLWAQPLKAREGGRESLSPGSEGPWHRPSPACQGSRAGRGTESNTNRIAAQL